MKQVVVIWNKIINRIPLPTKVISVAAFIMILIGVFPHWKITNVYKGYVLNKGYHFIFSPPAYAEIDFIRLVIQWFIVALAAGVFLFILKSMKDTKANDSGKIATDYRESKADKTFFLSTINKPQHGYTEQKTINMEKPAQEVKQIRPWVRYWARIFDIYLFTAVISYPFGYLLGSVFPAMVNDAAKNPKGVGTMLALMMVFIWVFVESFLLSTWGTTPGKWLLNVKVISPTGEKLFFFEAIYRSFSVWIKGLCIGLPIFSLITLAVAHKKLTRDRVTTWDERGEFVVSHKKIGAVRVTVFLLIWIVLAIFTQVISEKYKQNTHTLIEVTEEEAIKAGIHSSVPQTGGHYYDANKIVFDGEVKSAEEWFNEAVVFYQDGKCSDPKKAIQYLDEAIRLKPDYVEAYVIRGIAYINLGYQYQQAIDDCNEAIRLDPNNFKAYNNRGLAYMKTNQSQKAIEDYSKAIHLKPNVATIYNNRGSLYLTMGGLIFTKFLRTYRGCSDVKKACSMGDCKVYEWAKNDGFCQ